jgi:hypothetical protein
MKHGNVKILINVTNGEQQLQRNSMTWKVDMCGMRSVRMKFLKIGDASNVSGFLNLRGTVFLEHN